MNIKSIAWYSAAISLTVMALVLLLWLSLGVGIIGGHGNIANLLYLTVLLVTLVVAVRRRFQPAGMMWALSCAALLQAVITLLAVYAGWGLPYTGPLKLILLNGFFVLLYLGGALMFRQACKQSA